MRPTQLISILLSLFMLMPSILRTSVLIDFALRHDYIAKVLCINQDKPELQCDGKCYLAQQFKKAEDNEKKTLHNYIVTSSEISLFILPEDFFETILEQPYYEIAETEQVSSYVFISSTRIDHPPEKV